MWFLPSTLNGTWYPPNTPHFLLISKEYILTSYIVKAKKFNQARVSGRSNYDSKPTSIIRWILFKSKLYWEILTLKFQDCSWPLGDSHEVTVIVHLFCRIHIVVKFILNMFICNTCPYGLAYSVSYFEFSKRMWSTLPIQLEPYHFFSSN
jgi:hypothetical protein